MALALEHLGAKPVLLTPSVSLQDTPLRQKSAQSEETHENPRKPLN